MRPYLDSDEIRDRFSKAMSDMYQLEVPQYGTLLTLVDTVNRETLEADPALLSRLRDQHELARLRVERHGAIRVGTAAELATLRRLFAVMGMFPVGYYDLSEAGVPVHATAFRPTDDAALKRNPFRLFTSLLRLELIDDEDLRAQASDILARRQIFTDRALELITAFEQHGGLTDTQADQFVSEALETFRWHQQATVDHATYQALAREHRLIADVVCFKGPHINHLTPRTLDIDEVQRRMPDVGITPKDVIEGPPARQWPVLLRQTSFKALEETIDFVDQHDGTHTARFGEIEQRGVALTLKGRALYDQLLRAARARSEGLANEAHQQVLREVFKEFPDDARTLRQEGLAYFEYRLNDQAGLSRPVNADTLSALIDEGVVIAEPITYEDFLPVSAAGIFQSNLGGRSDHSYEGNANQAAFEEALGAAITSELALYARREQASIDRLGAEPSE